MIFSKSKYTQGVQCPKMLWMHKNMPDQFDDSVMDEAILETGNAVGDIAMGYFGPFVEVSFDRTDPDRYKKAVEETRRYIQGGERTICEAAFSLPGYFCMVDILRLRDDGSFDVIEVKSSTKMHDIYYHDLAFQCWLIEECGHTVSTASLMHINNEYVREGQLDLKGLFTLEDHTPEVREMIPEISKRLEAIAKIADSESEPTVSIGVHCFTPYECGFRHWCFRDLPRNNVFEICGLWKKRAFEFVERGSAGFDELIGDIDAFSQLTKKQQMQVLSEVNNAGPVIDACSIADFLDTLSFPLYFLDFETFQEAVPSYEGQRPYEQVTSQYSLHWLETPDGVLQHTEFLGAAGTDPRREVAEKLCADIPKDACVLAWNMGFEKNCIRSMAELFPDLSDNLMLIHDNIRDLMDPFKNGAYYLKEMKGSSSIKKVLPALFPQDPELDYCMLEGIHDGGEASNAFEHLAELPASEQMVVREQLLRYCELDTLAMVRIWERLKKTIETE